MMQKMSENHLKIFSTDCGLDTKMVTSLAPVDQNHLQRMLNELEAKIAESTQTLSLLREETTKVKTIKMMVTSNSDLKVVWI